MEILVVIIVAVVVSMIIGVSTQKKYKKATEDRKLKIKEMLYQTNKIFSVPSGEIKNDPEGLSPIKEASIKIVQKMNEFSSADLEKIKTKAVDEQNENIKNLIKLSIG